jgi:glycosyltransferase involved in cell wall biosynthesis
MSRIGISVLHIRPGRCGSHEPYLVNLVHCLSEIDQENQYVIFVNPINARLFEGLGSNFRLVFCTKFTDNRLIRIWYEQAILPYKILRNEIQLVHFPGNTLPLIHAARTVVTIHTDSIRARSSMDRLHQAYYDFMLRANRGADMIIAPTETYARQLAGFFSYDKDKLVAIQHGCNSIFFERPRNKRRQLQQKWDIEEGAILSVITTWPHKNLSNLLAGMESINNKYKLDPQLVIVGYIDEKVLEHDLETSCKNPGRVKKRIRVIQHIDQEQLAEVYSACSYFVLASKVESFGMPIIEAMASELPCALSNIPTFVEVAGSGALYFDPDDPEDIASKIQQLAGDQQLCNELIGRGANTAADHTWKRTARLTLKAYCDLLKT